MVGIFDTARLNLAARYYAEVSPDGREFSAWWASQQQNNNRYESLILYFQRRGYGATPSAILGRVTADVRAFQQQRAQPRIGTSGAQFMADRTPRALRRAERRAAAGKPAKP